MVNALSIIVTCEVQQQELIRLLPQLHSLQYEGEREVIVVDKKADKDMAEWLEEMEVHYPHLHHTFCPSTARGIDIHRLALTLGAKAANFDWLVVLSADTVLPDGDWLQHLSAGCLESVDVAIGRTSRKHPLNRFTSYLVRRRFTLFRPTSSILLLRRSILLHESPSVTKKRIICLPL